MKESSLNVICNKFIMSTFQTLQIRNVNITLNLNSYRYYMQHPRKVKWSNNKYAQGTQPFRECYCILFMFLYIGWGKEVDFSFLHCISVVRGCVVCWLYAFWRRYDLKIFSWTPVIIAEGRKIKLRGLTNQQKEIINLNDKFK